MNEAVVVASELWSELKRYVNTVDRDEAAETIVAILIDNDCDVDDIKNTFKSDSDIKRALTAYLDNDKSYEDEDEEEADEEEDYHADDWEN
jgi:preprotein translocase subunit Sec63